MHLSRRRRAMMAAVATLCAGGALAPSALAASGDLPKLTQLAPTGISLNFYDDHSIGGDNHMGWNHAGSDGEPLAIGFQSSLRNDGDGALQLCANGGSTTVRTGRQTAPATAGDCSGTALAGAAPSFRYAIANHSDAPIPFFNRWHVMDLQRFALVPLNGTGTAIRNDGTQTLWDNGWGTCLQVDGDMACEQDAAALGLDAAISPHTTKLTQEGSPDQAAIVFGDLELVQSGRYQVVALSNPYGTFREAGTSYGSVACTDVQITADQTAGTFSLTQLPSGSTCFLPHTLPTASGATGTNAFANAVVDSGCTLHRDTDADWPANDADAIAGHCWLHVPTANDPTTDTLAPHPLAQTALTAGTRTATDATPVAAGSAVHSDTASDPTPDPGTGTGVQVPITVPSVTAPVTTTAPVVTKPVAQPLALPALLAPSARSKTRTALRRMFGTLPSSAKVSCVITGATTSRCTVSWTRSGAAYRGTVRISFTSDTRKVSWVYSANVRRTLHGRTRTYLRSGVTGGRVSTTAKVATVVSAHREG
jgi:hypothetical protein